MPSPALLVAHAYTRRLLPGRLASALFWRLASRDQRIAHTSLRANVIVGSRRLNLIMPLASVGNWTILFNALDRSADAPALREMDRLLETRGDFIDVGANVGVYSFYAAAHGRRVLAVEANPQLAAVLQRNFAANQLNAEVVEKAATDHTGSVTLHLGVNDLVSSLDADHVAAYGGESGAVEVEATTLDALVTLYDLAPSVVKIDVEGHEVEALRGATRTLTVHQPAVLIEATAEAAATVNALLIDRGYRGRRFDGDRLVPIEGDLVPRKHPYANLLYEAYVSGSAAFKSADDRPQVA